MLSQSCPTETRELRQGRHHRESYAIMVDNFRLLRRKYDALKVNHADLLWSRSVLISEGLEASLPPVVEMVETAEQVGEISVGKKLGSGSFSEVFLGLYPDGTSCALKRITKDSIRSVQELRNIANECDALKDLSGGPSMLKLFAVLLTRKYLYVVMENFGRELYDHLKASPAGLPSAFASSVVYGVTNALAFMHELQIVHRDIKPENVLVRVDGPDFDDVSVKLCDMGLCTKIKPPEDREDSTAPLPEVAEEDESGVEYVPVFQCCGSMGFFAPEMLDPLGYDAPPCDMWSLACLALETLIGSAAFSSVWFAAYRTCFSRPDAAPTVDAFRRILAPRVEEIVAAANSPKPPAARESAQQESALSQAHRAAQSAPRARRPAFALDHDAALRAALHRGCVGSVVLASCLRLDPAERPHAFEARDVLAAARDMERGLLPLGGALQSSSTLMLRQQDPQRRSFEFEDSADSSLSRRLTLNPQSPKSPTSPRRGVEPLAPTDASSFFVRAFRSLLPPIAKASAKASAKVSAASGADLAPSSSSGNLEQQSRRRPLAAEGGQASRDGRAIRSEGDRPVPAPSPPQRRPSLPTLHAHTPTRDGRALVLVVDDSAVQLLAMRRTVERAFHCEVHAASNAVDALALFDRHSYDLVLTDLVMPRIDGFQLVSALRAKEMAQLDRPRAFICAVSQLSDVLEQEAEFDVDLVAKKPLDARDLEGVLSFARDVVVKGDATAQ